MSKRSRKRKLNKKQKKKLLSKIPKFKNTLRKYINPTEEILMQKPIEEIQLDIEITIKELISHCLPTSNYRLEQTLIVLQQALSVNSLIPNDTAIFVHEQ
ncbi:hypothetical protein C2G38_2182744 [Gigaspora rosea]|uniref:Uncharacterized protein n=1 Tax=Gigaspora rosea TaxID=44941 RepID=A0A397V9I2_9GLOM|nr:hypothetical protein C2G38_2182744 [Gigaspora rosea]